MAYLVSVVADWDYFLLLSSVQITFLPWWYKFLILLLWLQLTLISSASRVQITFCSGNTSFLSCFCGCSLSSSASRVQITLCFFGCSYLLLLQGCKWLFCFCGCRFSSSASKVQINLSFLQSSSWLQFSMQLLLALDYFYSFSTASTFFLASKGKLQLAKYAV